MLVGKYVRSSRRLLGCAFALVLIAGVASAGEIPAAARDDGPTIAFDIPAQPLGAALERYGDGTGREVLYDAALARSRRSGAVQGVFTPAAALRLLLEGTGLSARFMADRTFVLVPPPEHDAAVSAAPAAVQQGYYARIQASLRNALCSSAEARPGRYRLAALFWIGSSGKVARYERLGSTGAAYLDTTVDDKLRTLAIGGPPPVGFRQPVLVMIVPQAPGVTLACEPADAGLHAVRAEP